MTRTHAIPGLTLLLGLVLWAAPLAGAGPGFLTGPSDDDPVSIAQSWVEDNLGALGLTGQDIADWVVSDSYRTAHNGVTHVYFAQRLEGIPVFAGVLNVNVAADGRVIAPGSRFVSDLAGSVNATSPTLTAADAVQASADALGLEAPATLTVVETIGGPTQAVVFAGDGLSMRNIPVELVYLPRGEGSVRLAWEVEIEPSDQEYWMSHVDAETGKVLRQENLVESDTYSVYEWPAESPNHVDGTLPPGDGRTVVDETAADATASPFGWHDLTGTPEADTVNTTGNNVFAQTDLDANDVFTPGIDSQPVSTDREFLFPLDLTQGPETYLDAAVTNLFYWNNVNHDIHHLYGFDEAAGNFQVNNYLRGGLGGDPVQADAQDGSGTNNANMLTLPEGIPPRMQMFRWTAPAVVEVNSPYTAEYPAATAGFGEQLTSDGLTGDVVLVDDGAATTSDACEDIQNDVVGKICLIDRGTCEFGTKVLNCEEAGGIAAIVVNNDGDALVSMGPGVDGGSVTIPSVFIGQSNGDEVKAALPGVNVTLRKFGVDRDSDLDNGVILHEYGHGVSNRLTGGPVQTPICLSGSQQAGEGWSDWWALAFTQRAGADGTEPRGIGTYVVFQDPPELGGGIRPFPYSTDTSVNPQTYGDLATGTLSVPHGVGTVWATATWEVYWALVNGVPDLGLTGRGFREDLYDLTAPLAGNQLGVQLVTDGLKMQPCNPTFLDARDAILAADLVNSGGANQCHIWWAFAKRGMGVGANDGGSSSSLEVTEDFSLPPECTGGECEIPPAFDGATGVVSATDGDCRLTVHWQPAEDNCDTGILTYQVYRSTDPAFVPAPENLIADGVVGTSYDDTAVESGTTYYYVVRAVDGQGNTDGNTKRVSEEPVGTLSPGGSFADDAGDTGERRFDGTWAVRESGGVGDSRVYATSASGNYPDESCLLLESETIYMGEDPSLTFASKWDIEAGWDGGIVEVATASGAFADWQKLGTVVYPGVALSAIGHAACDNPGLADGQPVFTGTSAGEYVGFSASLFQYAGQAVRIRFVFGSDAAVNEPGWFVDNLAVTDVQEPGACQGEDGEPCQEIDDADPAVEYQRGWHRRSDPAASNGGYHRRMGQNRGPGGAPTARVMFAGSEVTYHFAKGPQGGTADVFLDGALVDSIDYGGTTTLEFGHSRTYDGLDPAASHELVIEHGSGAVYVDGFTFCSGSADASAARFGSESSTDTASASEGLVIERTVTVGSADVHVSAVVEGSLVALTVELLDPAGNLVASGEALIEGLAASGLDAVPATTGEYTLRILNTAGAFETLEVSVAKTVQR